MRGKEFANIGEQAVKGITPACAGKRMAFAGPFHNTQDHPRVCGEKMAEGKAEIARTGSPPRVRGKEGLVSGSYMQMGITPACAGKSEAERQSQFNNRDHPRVCGEKRRDRLDYYFPQGSPPRVRGKAKQKDKASLTTGITPACAGKRDGTG